MINGESLVVAQGIKCLLHPAFVCYDVRVAFVGHSRCRWPSMDGSQSRWLSLIRGWSLNLNYYLAILLK